MTLQRGVLVKLFKQQTGGRNERRNLVNNEIELFMSTYPPGSAASESRADVLVPANAGRDVCGTPNKSRQPISSGPWRDWVGE